MYDGAISMIIHRPLKLCVVVLLVLMSYKGCTCVAQSLLCE
jgi:hypothetical protein